MKFLTDQYVYACTVRLLIGLGHDVVTAAQLNLSRTADADLLQIAHEQERILVTRDRDFGALTFIQGSGAGVIYLRILPSTLSAVHAELESILLSYADGDLLHSFLVVEPARHRIRRP